MPSVARHVTSPYYSGGGEDAANAAIGTGLHEWVQVQIQQLPTKLTRLVHAVPHAAVLL